MRRQSIACKTLAVWIRRSACEAVGTALTLSDANHRPRQEMRVDGVPRTISNWWCKHGTCGGYKATGPPGRSDEREGQEMG